MANTAPQFYNLDGYDADGGATYTLGDAAIHIDTDASVFDAELGPVWTGARLRVQRYHDVNADDLFGLQLAKGSGIALDGETGALQYDFGDGLATFAHVTFGKGALTVDFAADAGAEAYDWLVNEVLQAITYANGSADTSIAGTPVTVSYQLEDMPGQAETLIGYGEAPVTILRDGNTLDFSAAGDLTFDLDHDPETKGEHAQSVALVFQEYEAPEELRVSSSGFPFGSGPGYVSGSISGLTGYGSFKISSAIGTDGGDFFYASTSRALHLWGGLGSDTFAIFEDAAEVTIDGGGHRIDETGSQEFHDAIEYTGSASITLDLAATDGEGFATVTRTRTDKWVVSDRVKDIEIVRATDGVDVIKGNDTFNAFIGFGGNDILEGRGGNDWLSGWTGDDTIDGGAGYDTASFSTPFDELGIKVDLNAKDKDGAVLVTVYRKDGPETDKLYSIESIEGGTGDDEITGDAGDNVLAGFDGKNIIDAGAGNDLVYLIEKDTASTQVRLGTGDDFLLANISYGQANTDTLILVGSRADYDVWDVSAKTGTSGLVLIQEQYYSYAGKFLGIKGRAGTAAQDQGTDIVNSVERFVFLGADGVQGTKDDEVYTAETLLAPVNTAPTGTDRTVTTLEDTPYTLTAADFGFADADLTDTLAAVRIDDRPSVGALQLDGNPVANGTVVSLADIVAGKLALLPFANENGAAHSSFTFSVQDSRGAFDTSPNTVVMDVKAINDAPVFLSPGPLMGYIAPEDYGAIVSDEFFLSVAPGPDDEAGQSVTVTVDNIDHPELFEELPSFDAEGRLHFKSAPDAAGSAWVTLTAKDDGGTGLGGIDTATRSFEIMIVAQNDAPYFTPLALEYLEDMDNTFGLTGYDVDGTVAKFRVDALPAHGTLYYMDAGGEHVATLGVEVPVPAGNGLANFRFDPAPDFAGADELRLTPIDNQGLAGETKALPITVFAVDDGAGSAAISGLAEVGRLLTATPGADIPDGGVQAILGYQWQRDPGTGFADIAGATAGTYALTLDDANARVRALVTYVDGQGFTNTATSAASDLVGGSGFSTPTASPDANQALAVVESGVNNIANQVTIGDSVLDNDHDADAGDALHVSGVAAGAGAGPVSGGVGRAVTGTYGTLRMSADGTWTYIINNSDNDTQALKYGQTADDVFTYAAMDTTGRAASSTLTVHVQGDDDAPLVSVIPVQTGDEDEPLTIDVLAFARDPEGGMVTLVGTPTASHGSVAISGGQLVYMPAAGYNGPDTIIFSVQDETGLSITRAVPVAITPVNDAPTATSLFAKGAEDTLIPLTLTASDPDAGDRIETFRLDGKLEHGRLYLDAAMQKEMSAGIDYATGKDGKLSTYFRPDDDFAGTASFMFRAGDGEALSDPAKLTVTVTPVNDAPRADDKQVFTTLEDGLLNGKLAAVDVDGDNLTFALYQKGRGAVLAQHGKVVLEKGGEFTYTPDKDFFGRDAFTYTVKDPSGATITRTAVMDVASVNDAPVFSLARSAITINEDSATLQQYYIATGMKTGPANESGQSMILSVVGNSNENLFHGTPFIDQTGLLSFRLLPNASGSTTVTIRLQDNGGEDNSGVSYTERDLVINVRSVNDAPVGAVTISDITPTERDVLTATPFITDADGMPGPISYQWQIQSGASWVNLAGANGATLTVEEGFAHKALRVQASYVDGGGALERVTSAATIPVARYGIAGTPVDNVMFGTEGDDVFLGSLGSDRMNGYGGNDTVNYIDSPRTLVSPSFLPFDVSTWTTTGVFVSLETIGMQLGLGFGGFAGADVLSGIENVIGTAYDDNITGNADANRLEGRDGKDWLRGLWGNDNLYGGNGNDRLEGGDGDDTLYGEDGNDVLVGGWLSDTLYGGAGNDELYAEYDIPPPLPMPSLTNTLFGGDGNDRLFGGLVTDYLYGENGADRIDGGAGNDRIEGGDDNDVLIGGLGSDFISGGGGNDTIWGAAEGLAGLPDAPFLGNNDLYGGAGNDTIYGNAGNDVIVGGAGYDRMTGGLANDRFVFNDGDSNGGDLILDFTRNLIEFDVIDLSQIDANTTLAGNQDFAFQTDRAIAQTTPGSLYVDGGRFVLGITTDAQFAYLNLDYDAQWEMTIEIRPSGPGGKLTAAAFTL